MNRSSTELVSYQKGTVWPLGILTHRPHVPIDNAARKAYQLKPVVRVV